MNKFSLGIVELCLAMAFGFGLIGAIDHVATSLDDVAAALRSKPAATSPASSSAELM